jgi:DNA-binding NtrC family response regulator
MPHSGVHSGKTFLLCREKTTIPVPQSPMHLFCNMHYAQEVGHILLVDDNQTFLYASRELLLRHRPTFIVDTAFDAETALTAIRTHDYDVVVSDLVLPRLDGIALLYECHQVRPDTPVVLISGYGWYPQAVEQARRQSNAIAERLRKAIQSSKPPTEIS